MKTHILLIASALAGIMCESLWAQNNSDLDLSTRCVGVSPSPVTVNSVAQWMENPLDQKLQITVSNFCAAASDYMDVTIGVQHFQFYGAGQDYNGQYIPTNYAPVTARVVLRRDYPFAIMCPNSGPGHSPLFQIGDLSPTSDFMVNLTNSPTDPISTFLWTNFTPSGQFNLTNSSAVYEVQETNLVEEMNRIISTMQFYTNGLFASYTNLDPIPSMITNITTSQIAIEINRVLLKDVFNIDTNYALDESGTADIAMSVEPPPELRIKKNQPAPSYNLLLNGDSSSDGLLKLQNPGTGYVSTNSGIVKVLKDKFGHFGFGDGCDDATKAPGQGSWLTMGPGCTEDTNRISLKWCVSLGRTFDGLAAGQIAIAESGLTRDTYTPLALYYNGSMTNLYATETLMLTNAPTYITNGDGSVTTNLFAPVQSQNLWAQVAISTNATTGTDTNIVFCTTYTTNDDQTITTNQFVEVGSQPVWTEIIASAPTNIIAPLFTNIVVYTNCQVPVVLVQSLVPYALTNSAGQLYTNYDTPLRQVKAYQTFVDIVTPDTNQTVLNFYHASDVGKYRDFTGLYTNFTANPFVSYTIRNPEPATANKLNIIETRNGLTSTQSLQKATSSGGVTWTLTLGTGPEQRVETRQVQMIYSNGTTPTDRIESNSIAYASNLNAPAYQCQETYHCYHWGWELKATSIPNGTATLTTTYDYYDNVNDPYGEYGYGQLKQIVYPDGYWEVRRYYVTDLSGDLYYMEVLHPSIRQNEYSATSPADADDSNCQAAYYDEIYPEAETPGTRWSITYDHADSSSFPVKSNLGSSQEANGTQVAWTQNDDGGGFGGYGDSRSITVDDEFTATRPLGLAGHTGAILEPIRQRLFMYHHGVFDPAANIFATDPNSSTYSQAGLATNYPDHAVSMFDVDADDANGGIQFTHDRCHWDYLFGGYLDLDEWANGIDAAAFNSPEYYTTIDGELLSGIGDQPFPLHHGLSKKLVKIYHGGNLVQSEMSINTALGTLNGDGSYYSNPGFTTVSKTRYYLDALGRATNVVLIDAVSQNTRTLYTADYSSSPQYGGQLLLSETDENGKTTSYCYDSLERVVSVTVKGFNGQPDQTTTNVYDADGRILRQTTTSGGLSMGQSYAYDLAGRATNHVDQSGVAVGTSFSADNLTTTTTYPGNVSVVKINFIDRLPASVSGNGCVPQYYVNQTAPITWGPGEQFTYPLQTTYLGRSDSRRWTATGTDKDGNAVLKIKPAGTGTDNVIMEGHDYWDGKLLRDIVCFGTNDAAVENSLCHYYFYNDWGNSRLSCSVDQWRTSQGISRAQRSITQVTTIGTALYAVTTNYTYLGDNSPVLTVQSVHQEQLNGFTGSTIGYSIDFDADNNETDTTTTLDRASNKMTVTASKPYTSSLSSVSVYQNGRLTSVSTFSGAATTNTYDALGRTNMVQDAQGNFTLMTYDASTGWLTSMTDPAGHTTSYAYYGISETNSGKLKCQTDANSKKTWYAYTTQGQLYRTWGDVPYPAEYRYNEYGDLTNLITFRSGTGWNGSSWPNVDYSTGDNTYWVFDDVSGALLQKIDAQGRAVSYTYYPESGRLCTRSWARTVGGVAVTVTNLYDSSHLDEYGPHDNNAGFGDLVSQQYNDGTPNVYFNGYNRAGQPREIIDGSGTNELVYDNASRLLTSTCTNGLLQGITVGNHFDWRYGRDKLTVSLAGGWTLEDDYGYDSYGRLGSVTCGTNTASYGYVPHSDLLKTTTFTSGPTLVMTTTRKWNYGFQLASIANVVDGTSTPVTSHAYTYDAVNRRTQATLEDNSTWQYGYNDRNELTGANRYWYDSRPVSGQQFGYNYDNIGNRTWARFGGDTNGGNLQTISYTPNSLNQYTSIVTPGMQDIIGAALGTNSVTVNAAPADRHGEYFHRQISVANTNQPVFQTVSVSSGGATSSGGLVFPANNQTLAYDADGNLTFDGVWNYQWDGENRLVSMNITNIAGMSTNVLGFVTNRLRLDFAYDYLGRRVEKTVSVWNSTTTSFQTSTANTFVYDGWNLVAKLNDQSSILQSFVWGSDLSGTMVNAGGVGGLLMANISGTNCFAGYDGNGNLTSFINAADRSLAARYEYNPYGQLLRETGLLASEIPFRFSTKFWDNESGLVYYGFRYYNPINGRWISRDPSEEKGGINLYQFVNNSPIHLFDPDGQYAFSLPKLSSVGALAETASDLFWASSIGAVKGKAKNPHNFDPTANLMTAYAMAICVDINNSLGGLLLKNVGGNVGFVVAGTAGIAMHQSLAAGVVSGRLEALTAIGKGADALMAGERPGSDESERAGYDFCKDLQSGNSAYGDLDAALIGAGVAGEMVGGGLADGKFAVSLTTALLSNDVVGALSSMPDYNGLNAWDMANSLQ